MSPEISIIFVHYNAPLELMHAIASIKKAIGTISYEIIIVDNNSPKKIPRAIVNTRKVNIIKNRENVGYGAALNIGTKKARGKYYVLANPDIVFSENAIVLLRKRLEKDKTIEIIGPQLTDTQKNILPSISAEPTPLLSLFSFSFLNKLFPNNPFSVRYWMKRTNRMKEQFVDIIGGACMMVREDVFKSVTGFDERFFLYFEESDLCIRVKKAGYKILYYPKAYVVHHIGRSNASKSKIQSYFEQSRFYFFKKHYGMSKAIMTESFLRIMKGEYIALFCILLISAYMNLYRITSLMMFIGDFGHDYLSAREMLTTGHIPLVGIPSSVIWLHQGPLSVYGIAFALFLGNFHPTAPAIFYGFLGIVTTSLVYLLGKEYFNTRIGLIAALFYATSPMVVINTRMPYHTSLIPFFTCVVFLLFLSVIHGNRKLLFLLFFSLGLLLQTELSNGIVLFIFGALWLLLRPKIHRSDIGKGLLGLTLGIAPFIFYDLSHHFIQTIGFPLWVANRIRLFLGLTLSGNATTGHIPTALSVIWQQIVTIIFPQSQLVVGILIFLVLLTVTKLFTHLKESQHRGLLICTIWVFMPLVGYLVHAAPGTAYFPFLFPVIALLIGWTVYQLSRISKLIYIPLLLIMIGNMYTTLHNEYYLTNKQRVHTIPPFHYSIGTTWTIQDEIVRFIVRDAHGQKIKLQAGGFWSKFPSGIDDYKYLYQWRGGLLDEHASLTYMLYANKADISKRERVVFTNKYVYVTKHE